MHVAASRSRKVKHLPLEQGRRLVETNREALMRAGGGLPRCHHFSTSFQRQARVARVDSTAASSLNAIECLSYQRYLLLRAGAKTVSMSAAEEEVLRTGHFCHSIPDDDAFNTSWASTIRGSGACLLALGILSAVLPKWIVFLHFTRAVFGTLRFDANSLSTLPALRTCLQAADTSYRKTFAASPWCDWPYRTLVSTRSCSFVHQLAEIIWALHKQHISLWTNITNTLRSKSDDRTGEREAMLLDHIASAGITRVKHWTGLIGVLRTNATLRETGKHPIYDDNLHTIAGTNTKLALAALFPAAARRIVQQGAGSRNLHVRLLQELQKSLGDTAKRVYGRRSSRFVLHAVEHSLCEWWKFRAALKGGTLRRKRKRACDFAE